jgi:hypothetical protein
MKFSQANYLRLLAVFAIGANGQQLGGVMRGINYPGLSDRCLEALNTTVTGCPLLLSSVSVENPRLSSDQLAALCTTSCRGSLTGVRSTIKLGCIAPNDTIEFDSVVYPGNVL